MPHFARTVPVPSVVGGYRAFKPFVRDDFAGQCAYCLLSEILAGGEENFELDHFRPRSRFPHLINDFYNIYYACHPCNHAKLAAWPSEELEARGISFVDLCKDEFATHFGVEANGEWTGLTNLGAYTIDVLRLNRKHLVTIRNLLSKLGFVPHRETIGEAELRLLARDLEG